MAAENGELQRKVNAMDEKPLEIILSNAEKAVQDTSCDMFVALADRHQTFSQQDTAIFLDLWLMSLAMRLRLCKVIVLIVSPLCEIF